MSKIDIERFKKLVNTTNENAKGIFDKDDITINMNLKFALYLIDYIEKLETFTNLYTNEYFIEKSVVDKIYISKDKIKKEIIKLEIKRKDFLSQCNGEWEILDDIDSKLEILKSLIGG